MKIKKKKADVQKKLPVEQTDRRNFFIVVCVILLVNILIYFTAFPILEHMAADRHGSYSAEGSVFLKITVIVVTDIFLFVTLLMILSRSSSKNIKR